MHRHKTHSRRTTAEQLDEQVQRYVDSIGQDAAALRGVKRIVQNGGGEAAQQVHTLLVDVHMTQPNAIARLFALDLVGILFARSSCFRQITVANLPMLLERTVGIAGFVVPGPPVYKQKCRERVVELLGIWHARFGGIHREIGIARFHLKKLGLWNITNPQQAAETRDAQMRSERIKRERHEMYVKAVGEMAEKIPAIVENMDKMNSLFQLLVMDFEQEFPLDASKSDAQEAAITHKGMAKTYGLGSTSYTLEITIPDNPASLADPETEENKILYDSLRESQKLLDRYLALIPNWSRILSVEELETRETVSQQLKKVLDLRNQMEVLKAKAAILISNADSKGKASLADISDDEFDDEVFEEVTMSASDAISANSTQGGKKKIGIIPGSSLFSNITASSSSRTLTAKEKGKERAILTAESSIAEIIQAAPVVSYDDDLYYWDKKSIPFNSTGINFHHRFLGEGTGENMVPEHKMNELRTRLVEVDVETVDIPPCRAKLKNGNLCPRRDKVRCPFHGLIVPRDDFGLPLNPDHVDQAGSSSSASAIPLWEQLEGDVNATVGVETIAKKRKGGPSTALQEELNLAKKKVSLRARLDKAFKKAKKK
ncbi:hypothetical protein HDU78_005054 [Chytriomyces hyalinus]|nr:hypothetical protein HDU78_005054 [Chytriomyces hyalinus]